MISSVRCLIRSSVDHAAAPRAQLAPRELGDDRRERAHALAVERALQQPPLAQVLVAVEQRGSSASPANGRRNSQLCPAGAIAGSRRKTSRTASGLENSTIGSSVQYVRIVTGSP